MDVSEHAVEHWIEEFGYDAVPGVVVRRQDGCAASRPFAPEIRTMFDKTRGAYADAFACVDRVPTVALVDRLALPSDDFAYRSALRAFCERLWNQNLTRVVLVTDPEGFEAWSVDNPEATPERITRERRSDVETWSLSGLLSGQALRSRGDWFSPEKRVDKVLLENIQDLVVILRDERLVEPQPARELIARTIFVSYLEDRRIISEDYRRSRRVEPFYDLLGRGDVDGLEQLFGQLQKDLNGDFLRSTDGDHLRWGDFPKEALSLLYGFLSRTVLRSGQTALWRYDFSEIPIELIAGIYETFLASKDDDETVVDGNAPAPSSDPSQRAKRKQGAYYTPRLLAEVVVDMALADTDVLQQKIFDGACGSGMLLTTAFRRLIRAKHADVEARGLDETAYGFAARCAILREQIFGADIDEDACRLTSFSLYLALLSDLTPRDLAVLQAGGHKLPPLADNIRRGPVAGDFFSGVSEAANKNRFTIFLSNPPWRQLRAKDPAAPSVDRWIARQPHPRPHLPSREIAAAFALAAADCLCLNGRAALILPINLFLSAERTRREFRGDLLGRYQVDRIVNFADLRYLLFADARHPCVVLIAKARPPEERYQTIVGETFSYLTPKADISLAYGRLSVHEADAARLPTSTLIDEVPQLQLRYWGNEQDLTLLRRLWEHGRMSVLFGPEHAWLAGKGFHLRDDDQRRSKDTWSVPAPPWMRERPFLNAKHLTRDRPTINSRVLRPFPFEDIAREPSERRFFEGPRVLWPDGTNPAKGVNALYARTAFSFQHSVGVLAAPDTELGRLTARFVATYMRSSLGSWLSILLSASVSAERAKLHQTELFDWPFWPLASHPMPERAEAVLREVDRLLASVEDEEDIIAIARYAQIKPRLDDLVFDYFGLREDEQSTVRELATIAGPSLQPAGLKYKSIVKPLRTPPTTERLGIYAARLATTFRRWRDITGGSGDVHASTWTARRVPLGAALIELTSSRAATPHDRIADDDILQEIAAAMGRVTDTLPDALFAIPNLTIVDGPRLIIVKPLITRYWLERSAVEDAARIAMDLQAVGRTRDGAEAEVRSTQARV